MSRRIQFFVLYFSFFVGGISCNENSVTENKGQEKTESDSIHPNEKVIGETETLPSLFEKLIFHMDSLGYDPDTTYFDEKMYQEGVIHYANYESHFIHELLIDKENFEGNVSVEFSQEYDKRFSRVEDIQLYPWRMPDTPEGRMRNGVVELWTFGLGNEKDADFVFEFLENELNHLAFPFIKTRPYYFQCGKWVFMFHSSDSGVSYRHEQFYDWMKKECE